MKIRILGLATALAFCGITVSADTAAKTGVTPVQAELISVLHVRQLKVGGVVYARVMVDWHGDSCFLRSGATLEGHVVEVVPHTKEAKGAKVSLRFTRAQCVEQQLSDFELLLSAMAAPPETELGMISAPLAVSTFSHFGLGTLNIKQFSTSFNPQYHGGASEPLLLPRMKMGEVLGIRGLKLGVGTGPETSTVISSQDRDINLEAHTVLLLVPAQEAIVRVPALPGASHPSADGTVTLMMPAAPEAPLAEEEACVPPQCNVELPAGSASDVGSVASSISIRQLGYGARPQTALTSFDNDEALAYLGQKELLVAFNPHRLLSRHSLGPSGWTERIIRAAVVDMQTHQVTHTVDWELPDKGQYLWPLAGGRVLVHVASEMRVYGQGLKLEKRIPIEGPLAFVRTTPDAGIIAIGVVRERHTAEIHAQLLSALNTAPEEDVGIQVLNRTFDVVANSSARSGLMPPTLLNEGQVMLLAQPNMHYRILLQSWDNQPSTVTRFSSSCRPEISSIAPDYLFLVSCEIQSAEPRYSALRVSGKPALRGVLSPNETGYAVESSANEGTFVVKTVQSSQPVKPGAPASVDVTYSEELRVYRAADGRRLLRVMVDSPSSSRYSFALAPDGSQLAVMTRDQIEFYSVPGK